MTNLKIFLPHEIFFSGFLLITITRLLRNVTFFNTSAQFYVVALIASLSVIAFCQRNPSLFTWRLRLGFYAILMNILFISMRESIPLIHPPYVDAILQQIDHFLIGKNLSLQLQTIATPWLTELLSICYLSFFIYLGLSLIHYLFADLVVAKKFYVGLFTIYGIGFLSYTFFPAFGPYISLASQFSTPLHGYWITHWEEMFYPLGTNHADGFPSLHCAVSAFILWFDYHYCRKRFWWVLLPVIGLWFSTIYLRYHYFVDVIAGFSLTLFCIWFIPIRFTHDPRSVAS